MRTLLKDHFFAYFIVKLCEFMVKMLSSGSDLSSVIGIDTVIVSLGV